MSDRALWEFQFHERVGQWPEKVGVANKRDARLFIARHPSHVVGEFDRTDDAHDCRVAGRKLGLIDYEEAFKRGFEWPRWSARERQMLSERRESPAAPRNRESRVPGPELRTYDSRGTPLRASGYPDAGVVRGAHLAASFDVDRYEVDNHHDPAVDSFFAERRAMAKKLKWARYLKRCGRSA